MELIVFAFSVDLSAENSNLSAVSGNQQNQLFGCMQLAVIVQFSEAIYSSSFRIRVGESLL